MYTPIFGLASSLGVDAVKPADSNEFSVVSSKLYMEKCRFCASEDIACPTWVSFSRLIFENIALIDWVATSVKYRSCILTGYSLYTVLSRNSAVLVPSSTRPSDKVTCPLIATIFCRNIGSTIITPSRLWLAPHGVRCQIARIPSAERCASVYTARSRMSKDICRGPHWLKIRCSSAVGSPTPYGMYSLFERKSPMEILPLSVVITPTEPSRPPLERASDVVIAMIAYVFTPPEPRTPGMISSALDRLLMVVPAAFSCCLPLAYAVAILPILGCGRASYSLTSFWSGSFAAFMDAAA